MWDEPNATQAPHQRETGTSTARIWSIGAGGEILLLAQPSLCPSVLRFFFIFLSTLRKSQESGASLEGLIIGYEATLKKKKTTFFLWFVIKC